MLGYMGYAEKLQKLCVLRGIDQSTLASKVNLSKSSISRILSGVQEPKLSLAYELAKALDVTLDHLVDDSQEANASIHRVMLSDDEMTILKIVRRMGHHVAFDRLIVLEMKDAAAPHGGMPRTDVSRSEGPRDSP